MDTLLWVAVLVASVGWNDALSDYATAQRAAGRSAGTIRLHRHYLQRLADVHRSPWSATPRTLRTFLAHPGWAPETRKSARAAVRGFYAWATVEGLLEHDPAAALAPVRVPPALPRPAPEAVLAEAMSGADLRMRFMLMLAAYAGLRASEIAHVHGRDLVGDVLTVHGKGGKTRAVPIVHPGLLRRLQLVGDAWAFPNRQGRPMTPGHVSRLVSAALAPGWTCHTLRHRMATTAYAGTRDLLAVGAVLGHSRPETTQRYVRLPDDAVRAVVAAAL